MFEFKLLPQKNVYFAQILLLNAIHVSFLKKFNAHNAMIIIIFQLMHYYAYRVVEMN